MEWRRTGNREKAVEEEWEQRKMSEDELGIERKEWRWTGNREKGVETDWE